MIFQVGGNPGKVTCHHWGLQYKFQHAAAELASRLYHFPCSKLCNHAIKNQLLQDVLIYLLSIYSDEKIHRRHPPPTKLQLHAKLEIPAVCGF